MNECTFCGENLVNVGNLGAAEWVCVNYYCDACPFYKRSMPQRPFVVNLRIRVNAETPESALSQVSDSELDLAEKVTIKDANYGGLFKLNDVTGRLEFVKFM